MLQLPKPRSIPSVRFPFLRHVARNKDITPKRVFPPDRADILKKHETKDTWERLGPGWVLVVVAYSMPGETAILCARKQ